MVPKSLLISLRASLTFLFFQSQRYHRFTLSTILIYPRVVAIPCGNIQCGLTGTYGFVHVKWEALTYFCLVRSIWKDELYWWSSSSMAWCKTAVTPVHYQWSYCSLALSQWYITKHGSNESFIKLNTYLAILLLSNIINFDCILIDSLFKTCTKQKSFL